MYSLILSEIPVVRYVENSLHARKHLENILLGLKCFKRKCNNYNTLKFN